KRDVTERGRERSGKRDEAGCPQREPQFLGTERKEKQERDRRGLQQKPQDLAHQKKRRHNSLLYKLRNKKSLYRRWISLRSRRLRRAEVPSFKKQVSLSMRTIAFIGTM